MVPEIVFDFDATIPPGVPLRLPTEDEIPDDEGIGFFRNVWMILEEPEERSRNIISIESRLIDLLDELCSTTVEFESVAYAIENGMESYPISDQLHARFKDLEPDLLLPLEDDEVPLEGLDLGVAGLAYALSTIGAVPVASCRGHERERPWSDHPVVFVAIDEERANWLTPLVASNGCGFASGADRGDFLTIIGPSVRHMNKLATDILDRFKGQRNLFKRWLDFDAIDARYDF